MQIDITDMNEEELEMELRKVEADKDDFAVEVQNLNSTIDESEDISSKRYYMMNDVRELCSSEDILLLSGIEENQNVLIYEQNSRKDISEESREEGKRQQEYWEYYEEDIRCEIKERQDKQKENEQNQRGY